MALKDALTGLRALDRLLQLETKHGTLIEALGRRLDQLGERIQRLEAREEVVIARAEAAAGAAASVVASQHIGELALLVGGLDERVKRLEGGVRARALPSPDG
jgi:hypothetical protein